MMDLIYRPRRMRRTKLIRELCSETTLQPPRFIQPYFVTDGKARREGIKGLPGIYRESVDSMVASIAEDKQLGIDKIMLFGVTDRKDPAGRTAMDDKNPVILAVKQLKDKYGDDIVVCADVCLCAYTDTGHCGITEGGKVDNDRSVAALSEMAVALAEAGCDCVAPSDMMDGRIGAVRAALDNKGFHDTLILAYTSK